MGVCEEVTKEGEGEGDGLLRGLGNNTDDKVDL